MFGFHFPFSFDRRKQNYIFKKETKDVEQNQSKIQQKSLPFGVYPIYLGRPLSILVVLVSLYQNCDAESSSSVTVTDWLEEPEEHDADPLAFGLQGPFVQQTYSTPP
jgi:hypothetical protein